MPTSMKSSQLVSCTSEGTKYNLNVSVNSNVAGDQDERLAAAQKIKDAHKVAGETLRRLDIDMQGVTSSMHSAIERNNKDDLARAQQRNTLLLPKIKDAREKFDALSAEKDKYAKEINELAHLPSHDEHIPVLNEVTRQAKHTEGGARTKGRRANNKRRSRKYKRTVSRRKKRTPTIKRRRRKTKKNIRTRRMR
jgi:hypothetical protein